MHDDDDSPLKIHPFDAVTIPAMLILDGAYDPAAVSGAGIYEPVSVPVTFDMNASSAFGDRFTENLTALFIPDEHRFAALGEEDVEPQDEAESNT